MTTNLSETNLNSINYLVDKLKDNNRKANLLQESTHLLKDYFKEVRDVIVHNAAIMKKVGEDSRIFCERFKARQAENKIEKKNA